MRPARFTSSTLCRLLGTACPHRRRPGHQAPPLPVDHGSRRPGRCRTGACGDGRVRAGGPGWRCPVDRERAARGLVRGRVDRGSPTTVPQTRSVLDCYLHRQRGSVAVGAVTPAMIDGVYVDLWRAGGQKGVPLASGTLARVHVVVRAAFAQAMRWGWIWDNPAERAHRIVTTSPELRPPTPDELRVLLDHVAEHDPQLHVLLLLAAFTGARRAQLLGLRWHNVHLTTRRVSFCAGWVEGPNGPELTATKSKRRHVVDLDPRHVRRARRPCRRPWRPGPAGHVRVQRRRRHDGLETEPGDQGLPTPSPRCRSATVPASRPPPLHGHRDAPRRCPSRGRLPPPRPPSCVDDARPLRPRRPRQRRPRRHHPLADHADNRLNVVSVTAPAGRHATPGFSAPAWRLDEIPIGVVALDGARPVMLVAARRCDVGVGRRLDAVAPAAHDQLVRTWRWAGVAVVVMASSMLAGCRSEPDDTATVDTACPAFALSGAVPSAALEADVLTIQGYGDREADFGFVRLDPTGIVAGVVDHLAQHRAALAQPVNDPTKLLVCRAVVSKQESESILAALQPDLRDTRQSWGIGPDGRVLPPCVPTSRASPSSCISGTGTRSPSPSDSSPTPRAHRPGSSSVAPPPTRSTVRSKAWSPRLTWSRRPFAAVPTSRDD